MTRLRYVLLISGVLLVAAAIAGVAQPEKGGAANDATTKITVTGNGSVNATPDKASFNFGVQVNAATAEDAINKANAQAQAIIDALKSAGVSGDDIQTSSVSLWPQTSPEGQVTGYQASNSVSVTAPIGKSGSLVDAAVGAGANNIYGPSLSIGDQSSYYAQALKLAVADAKAQAQAIADAAGLTLGGITHVTNNGSTPGPIPYYEGRAMDSAKVATPIEAGTQEISATVTVTYSAS